MQCRYLETAQSIPYAAVRDLSITVFLRMKGQKSTSYAQQPHSKIHLVEQKLKLIQDLPTMRLSFVLLVVTAATLLARGNALSAGPGKAAVSSVVTRSVANAGECTRFLRGHRLADGLDDSEEEERGVRIPVKSKMLNNESYRQEIFDNWLKENVSSMRAWDLLKVEKKEKYRPRYNEYARLHRNTRQYP